MFEKQPLPKNKIEEKKKGPSFFKRVFSFGKLLGDVAQYATGDDNGDELKGDIEKIEKQRRKEKERLAKERKSREREAHAKVIEKRGGKELLNKDKMTPNKKEIDSHGEKSIKDLMRGESRKRNSGAFSGESGINFLEDFSEEKVVQTSVDVNEDVKKIKQEEEDFKLEVEKDAGVRENEPVAHKSVSDLKQPKKDKKKWSFVDFFKRIFKKKPKVKLNIDSEVDKLNKETFASEEKAVKVAKKNKPALIRQPISLARNNKPLNIKSVVQVAPAKPVAIPKSDSNEKSLLSDKSIMASKHIKEEEGESDAKKITSKLVGGKEGLTKHFTEERLAKAEDKVRSDVEDKAWHSHHLVKANLIKNQEYLFFDWQRKTLSLILVLFVALLMSGAVYGGLLVYQNKKINDNQYIFDNLDGINEQIRREKGAIDEIIEFGDKLSLVSFVLDNHIYWSSFFGFLEDYTVNNVYYKSFQGDLSGVYSIPAVAKDFDSIYLQIKLMQLNDKVILIDTEGAKTEELIEDVNSDVAEDDGVDEEILGKKEFEMDLSVNSTIFLKLNNNEDSEILE